VWVSHAIAGMLGEQIIRMKPGMNRKVALKKPPKAEKSGQ